MNQNCDIRTVAGFGRQWRLFDQSGLAKSELADVFEQYFRIFPWHRITPAAVGLDIGCGTGRWAQFVAPRVRRLICVDASAGAVEVARTKLAPFTNCDVREASIDDIPVPDASLDFAYCLGVLHYIPEPYSGLRSIAAKLKPGAPVLIYVYYSLEESPGWLAGIWRITDLIRRLVAPCPFVVRYAISQLIAALVYYPLSRAALIVEKCGLPVNGLPLALYRRRSFYTMRTDALDRFGNRIEHRFTQRQVSEMMEQAGLTDLTMSPGPARWVAVGYKRVD